MVNNGSVARSAGKGTTELSADTLSAHLVDTGDPKRAPQVDTIVGRGHTLLRQTTVDGKEQTTAADSLDAKLRPQSAAEVKGKTADAAAGDKLAETLWSSVQQGHVRMMQRMPAKAGVAGTGDDVERAFAERAVYDGDSDRMTLSGGVQVTDADSMLWANQVTLDHGTGDSHAMGGVKVDYTADSSVTGKAKGDSQAGPTHVLADRAELEKATKHATFYGKPVRLWQDGNQIEAPVMEVSKPQRQLIAHGDDTGGGRAAATQVRTVLAGSESEGTGTAKTPAAGGGAGLVACSVSPVKADGTGGAAAVKPATVVRILSGGLTYSGEMRQADFTGGFRADTADGTMRAGEGMVYLKQSAAIGDAAMAPVFSGELDRVVSMGRVELDKPGLKATGERLVYTASDRIAVLTGDEKNPPKAVGPQGTTTGNSLLFRSSCDGKGGGSVEVLGAPGQRVRTDARIDDSGRKEKGKR